MDMLQIIVTALSFVGTEGAKGVIGEAAKNAYQSVMRFLGEKYPSVNLSSVESTPTTSNHHLTLVNDLRASGAAADPDFAVLSKLLIDAVERQAQTSHLKIAVSINELRAASVHIGKVVSDGHGIILGNVVTPGAFEIDEVYSSSSEESGAKKA